MISFFFWPWSFDLRFESFRHNPQSDQQKSPPCAPFFLLPFNLSVIKYSACVYLFGQISFHHLNDWTLLFLRLLIYPSHYSSKLFSSFNAKTASDLYAMCARRSSLENIVSQCGIHKQMDTHTQIHKHLRLHEHIFFIPSFSTLFFIYTLCIYIHIRVRLLSTSEGIQVDFVDDLRCVLLRGFFWFALLSEAVLR